MTIAEKLGILFSAVLLGVVATLIYVSGHAPTPDTKIVNVPTVGGGFVNQLFDMNGSSGATTTPVFLTVGAASTTIAVYSNMAESIDLNLLYTASTTSSCLSWTNSFSNNNIDWYYEDGSSLLSTISDSHGATALTHSWCPGVSGVSLKNIGIRPVASKYTRTVIVTTGANGSVYPQYILKNIIQN